MTEQGIQTRTASLEQFDSSSNQPSIDVTVDPAAEQNVGEETKKTFSQVIQKIQAKDVHITINKTSEEKCVQPPRKECEIKQFLQAVKDFKSGHLLLIADHLELKVNLQSIGLVPWTVVFDLDISSRSSGLLSQVESIIQGKRYLQINTWQDKCNISDNSTQWIFLKGANEQPDSKTHNEFAKWKKQTRKGLNLIVEQISKFGESYTDYYVVVLWPKNENMALHFKYLITELEETELCKFVIAMGVQVEQVGSHNTILKSLQDELLTESQPKILSLSVDDLCLVIDRVFRKPDSDKVIQYSLPTNDSLPFDISEHEAQWLKEDLEVLYKTYPNSYEHSLEILQTQSDEFYRGGNWPWHMWYEMGSGHVDIDRDIMPSIIDSLQKHHIKVFRSGRVTICHAPGSGGTTLSQRVLWELHEQTPCAQVKLRTGFSDVKSRVEFLYDKTRLPILLLLDGEDAQRVDILMQDLRDLCCIILYVKRYPYPMNDRRDSNGRFWLNQIVSKREATKIAYRYIKQCDDSGKKTAIEKLEADVAKGVSNHALIEFGLAAYRHQYKGIESYVKGFLQFENASNEQLLPWQKALAILSLAYYYGQMAMPCKFFTKLLGRESILDFEDFPPEMQALIVRDKNAGRTNVVRISHYLVAKEILEQVLPRPKPSLRGVRIEALSEAAKRNLHPFAVDFIKCAGQNATRQSSNLILKIMTRTFICRDNKAIGEADLVDTTSYKKRAKFSQILHDVSSKPPFTERVRILEALTKSFPREAQFLAHLGRFYSLCRPEDEESANKYFDEALEMCEKEIKGRDVEEIHHNMRLTLMHIYHMYGNMLLTRVSKYTGKCLGDQPKTTVPDERFDHITQSLFQMVTKACDLFTKCRDVTPPGMECDHGFIGEITIRLMFCDFIHRNCTGGIFEYMSRSKDEEIAGFTEGCISTIDGLILDCLSTVDPDRIEGELVNCQTWFTSLFRVKNPGRVSCRTHDTIKSRRIQIAARKLLYEKKKIYGVLEEVTNSEDIEFIVNEYEKNFEDIHKGMDSPRKAIDLDYREWIFAIRHKLLRKEYTVEDVLMEVRLWHEKVKTPNSRFYLFILCSLLGFGSEEVTGNTQLLIEAKHLKEDLLKQSKYIAKPKYPREWLGTGKGIRRLTPGSRFFGQIDGREIKGFGHNGSIETMIGTILGPNDKPASGYIALDLGETSPLNISVFYVPVLSNMKGPVFVGKRVQFSLGFSMAHGYEAYNVHQLQKQTCRHCGIILEMRRGIQKCKCGKEIRLPKP